MARLTLSSVVLLGLAATCRADGAERIVNGTFEAASTHAGTPEAWSTSGNPALRQRLTLDAGRDGGHAARLDCTAFRGDGPDYHAMICQVGRVGVERGQWYRLSLWAKASDLEAGGVEIGLVNTQGWVSSGLAESFSPGPRWARYEFLWQARADVPAATSRLQIWFKSTGTLWLDDLSLTETTDKPQWYPQIASDGVTNALPNSSFECGTAGWGSLTFGLGGWAGNLFRLEGQRDATVARHGRHSLNISLDAATAPVCWFDYYEPIREPVRRVLVANRGWIKVEPGRPLTLSTDLRADAPDTAAILAVNEAPERLQRRLVKVGREWNRFTFTFTPTQPFLFVAVGLDLDASKRDRATLWVDAIQLERGRQATAYTTRTPVESFVESAVAGNVFTHPAQGATLTLRAFNNSDQPQPLDGRLAVTDAFDQTIADIRPSLTIPAHAVASTGFTEVAKGRLGTFRARWTPAGERTSSEPGHLETLATTRFAVIDPLPPGLADSPFGFNHAYPWDYLVESAQKAGVVWWRDWSAKWNTVQPKQGAFDWRIPDAQVGRVLGLGGTVEVLLPFPSAAWSTTARPEAVAKAAGADGYLRSRLPVAYAPKDLADFGKYAAEAVRHYRRAAPRGVTHYQILNEPVYTDYALPRQFGYTLDDYLKIVAVAHDAMKAVDPACQVVAGISAGLSSGYTREFVTKGGLKSLDVFDLHMYDAARPAETYEEPFRALEELMKAHGGPKPVWITEWGCYADDDPPTFPHSFGDATMNRCRWPSERAATEHIVKFAAVGFGHGLRKIFFHAGTAGRINGADAGGVLFEYGGAPRTMYAGIAAFTRLVGVPEACLGVVDRDGLHAYVFRTQGRVVAVVWSSGELSRTLATGPGVEALDMMGNRLSGGQVALSETPVYLSGPSVEGVLSGLRR
jgi:Carbohydrate binding domain/Glycosyl hydrolase catalytic core